LEGFFLLKAKFKALEKRLYYLMSGFQRDDIFSNCKNTELKRSSKIFFSVAERHRRAVVG